MFPVPYLALDIYIPALRTLRFKHSSLLAPAATFQPPNQVLLFSDLHLGLIAVARSWGSVPVTSWAWTDVVPFWLLRAFYGARSSVGKVHWQDDLTATR